MSPSRTMRLQAAALGVAAVVLAPLAQSNTAYAANASSIDSGADWTDSRGELVRAGGAGLFKAGSKYYWVGEDHSGQTGGYGTYWWFQKLRCYSSSDLTNWKYEGDALSRELSGDLGPNRIVERPKVVYNAATKQYVLYAHIDSSNYADAKVGVAVSDTPCGPYSYRGSFRPLGNESRDMSLFQDSDGTAYLLSSANSNADSVIYRLSPDYLSVESEVHRFAGQHREAPALAKKDGTYFLVTSGSTYWSPNMQKYATTTELGGPWSEFADLTPRVGDSYASQIANILPVTGTEGTTYVFAGDRWKGDSISESRYVWLPLTLDPVARTARMDWYDKWQVDTKRGTWKPSPDNPGVRITKADPRTVTNLKVTASMTIDGALHYDSEDTGAFDHTTMLGLDGHGASWGGNGWTGDLLYTRSSAAGAPAVEIAKAEYRSVTGLRIEVEFDIDGEHYHSAKDLGALDRPIALNLDASGASWDGTRWTGDFLKS